MGSVVVVVGDPFGKLGVESGDVVGGGEGGEVFLHGAVVPLDFALCLGVVGGAVFLLDAELVEELFEAVGAAGVEYEAGGEDAGVVSEGGLGESVFVTCGDEGIEEVGAGGVGEGFAGDDVSGVIVENGEDMGGFPGGEFPFGVVELPGFVGGVGLELDVGVAGAFFGLWGDEVVVVEDFVDGGF